LVAVQPLTDRILMLHFDDGYVEHHRKGQPRSAEKVVTVPLDVDRAALPRSYRISSTGDVAFKQPLVPVRVGRKSKGTDFAWFADKFENGRVINSRPDHAAEHWLYLELPAPMKPGKTYRIRTDGLTAKQPTRTLTYVVGKSRSEAVHVNTLGYVPDAPQKFAYVYHWMGDRGSLDLKQVQGKPFYVVNTKTGKRVFTGAVRFRQTKTNQETLHKTDSPPHGNFLNADVWECDFSGLKTPGTYVVAVEGVGCSWQFRVDPDIYREAFRTVARGLYHNRSGIALVKPYTEFQRPAPHHPKLTPGFADKLRYTRVHSQDWGSEGGDAQKLTAESPGTLEDAWGWYQDAGDWDGYYSHLRPAQELLLVFEMGHRKFADSELNLPESGNGIPDIVDEAAWLPRFCYRLRQELLRKKWGTGGIGLRVAGDAFGSDEGTNPDGSKFGRPSYEDTDRVYMVSGEDALSTYRYAGVAASLAYAYRLAGVKTDPDKIDWEKEARESYAWAQKNTRPGDEKGNIRQPRSYAAAALFRLSGDKSFEAQFIRDTQSVKPDSLIYEEDAYGPFVYALGGANDAKRDPATLARIRAAVLRTADETMLNTSAKRALRWGGNF
ncbi:MAG: glycoside hydrolase family 9 protein, partial [Fibrella sp.]|nr:glycoside hydrolase family 9 protein [Armatimonadota bacterium]